MYRFNAPPGWPPPPVGWLPPSGWRPDPAWPPAPLGWQFWIYTGPPPVPGYVHPPRTGGWQLDREVATARSLAAGRWSGRVAWLPLVVVVVTVFGSQLLTRTLLGSFSSSDLTGRVLTYLLTSLAAYGVMLYACYRIGRPVAQSAGGMSRAFGWRRPTLRDAGIGVVWSIGSAIVRIVIVVRLVMMFPSLTRAHSNLNIPQHTSMVGIAVIGFVSILVAPPVEELVFRGLLLRTSMLRLSFWPAAVTSSMLFGLLHTYEVNTLTSAIVLTVNIGLFALGQCLLVRWRGGLGAAMVSHATSNAFALGLALLAAR